MKLYDAVIVGGAAVGASLALALGLSGRRVLLIEKDPAPSARVTEAKNAKTFALSYASAKIYSALGVWPALAAKAVPIKQVRVTMQGRFGSCRLNHDDIKTEALGYVIASDLLESALIDELQKCPYVEIQRSTTLADSRLVADQWHLQLHGEDAVLDEVTTRLLIASDGASSPLRQAQYIDCEEKEYGHSGIMVNLCLPLLPKGIALERFLKKGAIALLPWQENWVTCVWTMEERQAKDLLEYDDEKFVKNCQLTLGRQYGKISAIGKRYIFPLRMKLAKMQTSARFLLMGNAAHSLHPIAAQGLNLSLRDIWQLKTQIDEPSASRVDLGCPEFLENYINARRGDQGRIIFATDKIARFMASNRLPDTWRALGITLFDGFSPLKHQFTRYSMGLA